MSNNDICQTTIYVKQRHLSNNNICQTTTFIKQRYLSNKDICLKNDRCQSTTHVINDICQTTTFIKQQYMPNINIYQTTIYAKQRYLFKKRQMSNNDICHQRHLANNDICETTAFVKQTTIYAKQRHLSNNNIYVLKMTDVKQRHTVKTVYFDRTCRRQTIVNHKRSSILRSDVFILDNSVEYQSAIIFIQWANLATKFNPLRKIYVDLHRNCVENWMKNRVSCHVRHLWWSHLSIVVITHARWEIIRSVSPTTSDTCTCILYVYFSDAQFVPVLFCPSTSVNLLAAFFFFFSLRGFSWFSR